MEGPDALDILNQLSAADMDVPLGKVVYTQWLNTKGGIEADLTVSRSAEDAFMVVTAPRRARETGRVYVVPPRGAM